LKDHSFKKIKANYRIINRECVLCGVWTAHEITANFKSCRSISDDPWPQLCLSRTF